MKNLQTKNLLSDFSVTSTSNLFHANISESNLKNIYFTLVLGVHGGSNPELIDNRHTNPLNAELNPICHLLPLPGGATIVVVSRLRVKVVRLLALRNGRL